MTINNLPVLVCDLCENTHTASSHSDRTIPIGRYEIRRPRRNSHVLFFMHICPGCMKEIKKQEVAQGKLI